MNDSADVGGDLGVAVEGRSGVDVDVVVVGAGPVGLLMAIELRLAGVGVLVLERLATASTAMKAMSIGPLGSEALKRRGMAAALAEAEARSHAAMGQTEASLRGRSSKYSGHFAGLPLIRKAAQREPERRVHAVDQPSLEAMLADRAQALGIELRRGCELTDLVQQADGVRLSWMSANGSGHIRCAWLVGCDGGRSTVRKLAGIGFPGTPASSTFYQAMVELDHPERLLPAGWRRTAGGVFSHGPQPGRLFMLDFSGPPDDRQAPVTRDEIEAVLRRVSGAELRVQAMASASRWADNTRLADSYRRGRVLLAGDAAHVHSPFGGQGMNLGLVDAANLGWKLAAVLKGELPEGLLDSYTEERRSVARAVLDNTLAQVAILRPDDQAGAMRELIAKLMDFDEVNRFIGEAMTGLSTRYALGSADDAVGRLTGDMPLTHGDSTATLYALMQDGGGVLLDATADGAASARAAAVSTRKLRCVRVQGGPSMLIRPDACVAWVGDAGFGASLDGLDEALGRWFGRRP